MTSLLAYHGDPVRVFRVQDANGRGPFRPGFSREWCDDDFAPGMLPLPTWMEEFGRDLIDRLGRPGEHFGSAVRTIGQISRWFSATEQNRLEKHAFNVVSLHVTRVLAESANQLVFARGMPLARGALIVPWQSLKGINHDGTTSSMENALCVSTG